MNFDVLKPKTNFQYMAVYSYSICQCGAVTLYGYDMKTSEDAEVSCAAENLEPLTGFSLEDIQTKSLLKPLASSFQCNHCVNHWGLDLCACGSGQPVGDCYTCDDACGVPYQSVDEFRFLMSADGRQVRQPPGGKEPSTQPRTIRVGADKSAAPTRTFHEGDKVRLDTEAVRRSEGVPFFKQLTERYLQSYHGEVLEVTEIHEGEAFPYILSLGDDIAFGGQELIPVQPEQKMGNGLTGAIQLQRQLKAELKELVGSLTDKIRKTPVPGVKPVGTFCFTVSISSIMQSPGHMLSAEYYSSQAQADLVSKALAYDAANGRVEEMLQHLREMVNKKAVEINKVRYPLNDVTIGILNLAVDGMEDI